MQYILIKESEQNGKKVFLVPAISLKDKNNSVIQKIPHPTGTDSLAYNTLEEAEQAVKYSGFTCKIKKDNKEIIIDTNCIIANSIEYDKIVYNAIKSKVNSINSSVAAAAILAISEFSKEEVFDILFDKIGEDNEAIRKNAINGICKNSEILQDRIIKSLYSTNWVRKNSAITCINKIVETIDNPDVIKKFIKPLIEVTDDQNPIIQTAALNTLAIVYHQYEKYSECNN